MDSTLFHIGSHKWRADVMRTKTALMFVDIGTAGTHYCVRALVNGTVPFDREYHMAWFTDYNEAYYRFDDLNTGRISPKQSVETV